MEGVRIDSLRTLRLNLSTKFKNTKFVISVVMEIISDECFSENIDPVLLKISATYAEEKIS